MKSFVGIKCSFPNIGVFPSDINLGDSNPNFSVRCKVHGVIEKIDGHPFVECSLAVVLGNGLLVLCFLEINILLLID